MTVVTSTGKLFIGSKVVIPEPEEDDTWDATMISEVDDINDNDTIMFMDDDYNEHEIDVSRVQLYKGE